MSAGHRVGELREREGDIERGRKGEMERKRKGERDRVGVREQ